MISFRFELYPLDKVSPWGGGELGTSARRRSGYADTGVTGGASAGGRLMALPEVSITSAGRHRPAS